MIPDLSMLRMLRHSYKRSVDGLKNVEIPFAGWHFTWIGDFDKYVEKSRATLRHYTGNYEGKERSLEHFESERAKLQTVEVDKSFPHVFQTSSFVKKIDPLFA